MHREGHAAPLRRFFPSRAFLIVAFFLAVLLAAVFARAYYRDYQVKREIAALKEEVKHLEKKKLESLQILQYVMSENFVEEKARTELNLRKPNEQVVAFETKQKTEQAKRALHTGQKPGNPLKWWYYFTRHRMP